MKKTLFAVLLCILSLGLTIGDAEAKRFGGGRSSGMQRDSISQRQATPPAAAPTQKNAAAPAAAPQAGAAAAAPKRNWLGPIAGLAAGLGIAALLSHFGLGGEVANFLMIALLVFAAFFVFRLLFRRNSSAAPANQGLQYAGAPAPQAVPASTPQAFTGAAASPAAPLAGNIPEGFDSEGFVRIAKLNFIRLQAANDTKDLDDLREFVSPEMFAELKLQMDERGVAAQQTDVVTLNGELLEVVSDGQRHIASVRFNGMIREDAGAAAQAFDEVWNLTKPLDGNKGWVVAGIQQLG